MSDANSCVPAILVDRMQKDLLKRSHPEISQIMERHKLGKLSTEKVHVEFCGLVSGLGEQNIASAVFLPLKAKSSDKSDLDTAKVTMQVIAKYSRSKARQDNSGRDDSGGSWLSVIKSIADDFIKYGIYSDRHRIQGRNNGKANWARTIVRETPLIGKNGNIVYSNFCSSKTQDNLDNFLAQIQVAVLKAISKDHGWWLSDLAKDKSKLQAFRPPSIDPQFWAIKLKALLPSLFSSRAIRLTNYLIRYLEREPYNSKGPLFFGLNDFHNVWEKMLRDVLENTEDGWNTKLPKPYFYFSDTAPPEPATKKQMEMDMVVRQGSNLVIVDAKYYDATTITTSPSWPDISKQLIYELAMKDLLEKEGLTEEIHSCFVFPDFSDQTGKTYTEIKMEYSKGRTPSTLPQIKCFYIPIITVMQAYLNNENIALPSIT